MPKTKFQDFIYTLIMVIVIVYGMVCYNISLNVWGLQIFAFLETLKELPIMGTIAISMSSASSVSIIFILISARVILLVFI